MTLSFIAWRGPDRVGTLALWIALAVAGLARGEAHHVALAAARDSLGAGGMFWIEARLSEPPQRAGGSPLVVVSVIASQAALPAGARLRLRLPESCDAEWGDRVRVLARIDPPRGRTNPGGFDVRASADAGALAATGVARYAEVLPARGPDRWPRASVMRWRRAMERAFMTLTVSSRELIVPLVLGDRSALPTELDAAFRASGLIHLIALSGLHVAYLAALARGLVAALGAGVRGRALASALCAAGYVAIAGPLPSLVRAAAGELLAASAKLSNRALDPVQSLSAGALALLVVRPGWASDLGFQLSCAATLGLVTVGARFSHSGGRGLRLAAPFVPTASAQITALPLLLSRFHAVAWPAAISNLLAVPVSGLLLAAAWIGAIGEVLLPGSGTPWLHASEVLATALRAIVAAASRLPHALIVTGHEPVVALAAGAGAALLAVSLAPQRGLAAVRAGPSALRALGVGFGGYFTALAALLAATATPMLPPPGHVWLVALDVGQGDALAIATREGWTMVDAGPRGPHFDSGDGVVLPFLRWAGVRRLEVLALTHDDGDHIGGAAALLRGIEVARVCAPLPRPGAPGPLARFHGVGLSRGDVLSSDPRIEVLWPPAPRAGESSPFTLTSADNAAGLVLAIGSGGGRALLLADVDSTVEESLEVAAGLAVLKVAHHGSGSSSGVRFLMRLAPRFALLSVGARNRFGHPDPRTLVRLTASGAEILRTDRDGALWLDLADDGARIVNWRPGEPARFPASTGAIASGASRTGAPAASFAPRRLE